MGCLFEKYKNILGIPGKGIHKYRFLGTAVMDYVFSILLAILITYLTHIPLVLTTIGILVLGIVLHALFGVETNAIRFLKLTCK
jgi:hypothetical protein